MSSYDSSFCQHTHIHHERVYLPHTTEETKTPSRGTKKDDDGNNIQCKGLLISSLSLSHMCFSPTDLSHFPPTSNFTSVTNWQHVNFHWLGYNTVFHQRKQGAHKQVCLSPSQLCRVNTDVSPCVRKGIGRGRAWEVGVNDQNSIKWGQRLKWGRN